MVFMKRQSEKHDLNQTHSKIKHSNKNKIVNINYIVVN